MATKLKCPNCNHEFPLEAALNDELNALLENTKNEYRNQMNTFLKVKEDEYNKKEIVLKEQQAAQKKQWEEELKQKNKALEDEIRKTVAGDFENQIKILRDSIQSNEEKLKSARAKELEYLQKENALKEKEAELELMLQRQLIQEREKMRNELMKEEELKFGLKQQEFELKLLAKEKQLEDQKKLVEEMRRKAEQGSMQLQGEVQELKLEEILKSTFPFDKIDEVPKGVKGADCVQTVHNNFGKEAGKIIFESKNTKDFNIEWIEKLKADMRSLNADIAVIVSKTLPKELDRFGEKDGIYICTFLEVRSVVSLLRNGLLKLSELRKSQENKGDKMAMLYDYLTGHEFAGQWKAIVEAFRAMKSSIENERIVMEKLWKKREKQLEKVLLNATHVHGSIEGIAGADSINLALLDSEDEVYMLE
ncbi:MAG: DUF2130 domain-containing protein [Arachidicoccus sp.]|nr:DUF2130 domain-containing protein [Arachidicoccus sp.]